MFTTMIHYYQRQPDGTVHVSNWVGPYEGQHHVHDEIDFKHWTDSIPASRKGVLKEIKGCKPCDCGMKPGEVKSPRR